MTYGQDEGQPYGEPWQSQPDYPAARRHPMQGPPKDAPWQQAPYLEPGYQARDPRQSQQPWQDYGQRYPTPASNLTTPGDPSTSVQTTPMSLQVMFGSAVMAGLIAIGGLLLTIYTQKPGVVVPWALCVLGLSAFAPLIPQVPRLAQVCIVSLIAVALISSSIVVFADPRLLTHTAVQVVPGSGPAMSNFTTDIKLAPIAEPIPFCNEFLGTGTIPTGYELWIFDRDAEDPTAKYYLDSQAVPVGNNWTASNIQIGNGAGDTGHRTTILAVLLPSSFMDWLINNVNIENGIPSSNLPPTAHVADQAVVTRSSDKKPCPN